MYKIFIQQIEMSPNSRHKPVLLAEVITHLKPGKNTRILDVTLGLAGHAEQLLAQGDDTVSYVGLDADIQNLEDAKQVLAKYDGQCTFIHANFAELPQLELGTFDRIFADLGVSSPHFDDAERGFSFRADGPLDMRLDRTSGQTAAQMISALSDDALANVLYEYGEIRQSRKLSKAMKEAKPETTQELRAVCDAFFGYKSASMLPQVFQALRIAVNDELGALRVLLDTAPSLLNPGGMLGIIAFHSLEDRLVKQAFKALSTPEVDDMTGAPLAPAPFTLVTRKAIKPSEQELEQNPRARSARLRILQRV